MANNNYDLQLDKFNSRLKFYFSLMFMSKTDFLTLESYFGKNIDVFNFNDEKFEEKDIELLSNILENVKWNNNQISLTDDVISRLFVEDELIEYYNDYILENETFNLEDPEKLEDFLCFSMLNKIREKKKINIGTIYDFFEPATKQEIHKAISNLNGYDHEQFTMYFGINYDKEVKINTNDKVKNDLLIKLYSYILNNREENDIPILLTMVSKDLVKDYDLYDYIRRICGDDTISNDSIAKIISKLDYDTKLNIKLTYGKDYKDKKKAPDNPNFKKAIVNVVKAVKEETKKNKKKKTDKTSSFKRKAKGINEEEKKKNVNQPKKENIKDKTKKEDKKTSKEKESTDKKNAAKKKETEDSKKKKTKEEKKEKPKEESATKKEQKEPKKENKKERLNKFLAEYNLEKKDFLIAVGMLGLVSKTIVELYFGLKKEDPIDIEEIAAKLSRSVDIILDLLDEATKKIVDLVKSGKINEKKTAIPISKGFVEENKLSSFVTDKNPKKENLAKAVGVLSALHASIVGDHLGINGRAKSVSELAKDYNYSEKTINNIINVSSNPVINELSRLEKDEVKENKEEIIIKENEIPFKPEEKAQELEKKEPKKVEVKDKKLDTKKIKSATTLSEFLKAAGLTKDEFNYGYKSLDSLSKRIISLYFSSYTIEEIAKECNLSKDDVSNRIDNIKNRIIAKAKELQKAQSNMTLRKFLTENNISFSDFNKFYRNLTPIKQTVLNMYLGLNGPSLSVKEISDKLYRSEASINDIIKTAASDLKEMSKKASTKTVGRLEQFLKENNITKDQFNYALNTLSKVNQTVISMYFGLNGQERQIGDIASVTGLSRLEVVNVIADCKSKIITLSKTKDKTQKKNNANDELTNKAKDVITLMRQNPELAKMIKESNPIGFQALTMLANYNVNIDELSSILKVPAAAIISSLMDAIATANSYSGNPVRKTSAFHDTDGISRGEKDRSR